MNVRKEQLGTIKSHAVRNANVTDVTADTAGPDGLHHGLLRTHTLKNAVRANTVGHLLDAGDAFVAAFRYNVGCSEFCSQFLTACMTAHCNDAIGAHLFCG